MSHYAKFSLRLCLRIPNSPSGSLQTVDKSVGMVRQIGMYTWYMNRDCPSWYVASLSTNSKGKPDLVAQSAPLAISQRCHGLGLHEYDHHTTAHLQQIQLFIPNHFDSTRVQILDLHHWLASREHDYVLHFPCHLSPVWDHGAVRVQKCRNIQQAGFPDGHPLWY